MYYPECQIDPSDRALRPLYFGTDAFINLPRKIQRKPRKKIPWEPLYFGFDDTIRPPKPLRVKRNARNNIPLKPDTIRPSNLLGVKRNTGNNIALRPLYFGFDDTIRPPKPLGVKRNARNNHAKNNHAKNNHEPEIQTKFLAANCVLNTVELLEQILEDCLFIDLLKRLPRVSSTWKRVIDRSKYIQQHLFFTPWGPNDYKDRWGQINPFTHFLAYQRKEDWPEDAIPDWGPAPKKSDDEDTDDDADAASWKSDYFSDVYFRFHWRRVQADPRFMYKNASWRRMLPIQPLSRTVWNVISTKSERVYDRQWMRSIREQGKTLGDIYEDWVVFDKDPLCGLSEVHVKCSLRYGAVTQMYIRLKSWSKKGERIEKGGFVGKIRGAVMCEHDTGNYSEVVFSKKIVEEWGKTPWIQRIDPRFSESDGEDADVH